jgi:hypothetical protein
MNCVIWGLHEGSVGQFRGDIVSSHHNDNRTVSEKRGSRDVCLHFDHAHAFESGAVLGHIGLVALVLVPGTSQYLYKNGKSCTLASELIKNLYKSDRLHKVIKPSIQNPLPQCEIHQVIESCVFI